MRHRSARAPRALWSDPTHRGWPRTRGRDRRARRRRHRSSRGRSRGRALEPERLRPLPHLPVGQPVCLRQGADVDAVGWRQFRTHAGVGFRLRADSRGSGIRAGGAHLLRGLHRDERSAQCGSQAGRTRGCARARRSGPPGAAVFACSRAGDLGHHGPTQQDCRTEIHGRP